MLSWLVRSLLSMFRYLFYQCSCWPWSAIPVRLYLPVLIKLYDSNSRFRQTHTEPWVLARDRVREIDVRLRVKFSEISTGLDSLQDFKD